MKLAFANNLQEIENLMWYDGPVISHYRDKDTEQDYIMLWFDVNWTSKEDSEMFFLVFQITPADLEQYLNNNATMLDLLKRSAAIYECVDRVFPQAEASHGYGLDYWIDGDNVAWGKPVKFEDIPQDNLPTEKSYLRHKEDEASSN